MPEPTERNAAQNDPADMEELIIDARCGVSPQRMKRRGARSWCRFVGLRTGSAVSSYEAVAELLPAAQAASIACALRYPSWPCYRI
jgi:hypothetical protein